MSPRKLLPLILMLAVPGLQGCVAMAVGATAGAVIGVTGAVVGTTAKVGGAAVGAVIPGDGKKDERKKRGD